MKKIYPIIFLLLTATSGLYAQYTETFSVPNKGYLTNFVDDFAGVNWTMTAWPNSIGAPTNFLGRDAANYFQTTAAGKLEAIDLDVEVCWLSPELTISGGSAAFQLDLSWIGFDPNTDYIDVSYSTNGGSTWVPLANAVSGGNSHTVGYVSEPVSGEGNTGSLTSFGVSGITGPTLQIRVCVDNSASSEVVTLDNVSATNASVGGPPLTCDLVLDNIAVVPEGCPNSNDGAIIISATTSNGPLTYSITGPVNQSNSTGSFTGLPDGSYNILVRDNSFAAGSCDRTASRTIQPGVDNTNPTASNPANTEVPCIDDVPAVDPEVVIDETDNCTIPCTTEPWINEFHYDNVGTDVNEFVEIAGPAGLNLSAYALYLYDGSTGQASAPIALSGTIDNEENGFGALTFAATLQNQKEGIALVKNGTTVIEFLSYEGTVVALNGPANGLTSTDVGVSESDASQAAGESLARVGSGNESSEFAFVDQTATPGSKNGNQTFLACPENVPVVTYQSEVDNGGTIVRTYRVTDAAGNFKDVTHTITVIDNEAPTITCPSNIVVVAATGQCSAVLTFSTPSASDNCGAATVSLISPLASGSAFPVGTNTVIFEAEDGVGNTKACSFTIIVNDQEDPLIVCPADIMVSTDAGICGAVVNYTPPVGVDNCSGASTMRVGGLGAGATFPIGETTETYLVTDQSGNIDDCSFTVTVADGPPTINNITTAKSTYCPLESINLFIDGDLNGATEWVVYIGNDCGVSEWVRSSNSTINVGFRTVPGTATYYVRGEGGCEPGDCFQVEVNVEADVAITCATLGAPAVVGPTCVNPTPDYTSAPYVSVNDNCFFSYTVQQYPAPGTLLGPGVHPITMTVRNSYGSTDACVIMLTVEDKTAPTATSLTGLDLACLDEFPAPDPEVITDEMDNCEECPETVWINEFHYQNVFNDINESVEVAGTAGTDLSNYSLVFYDGANGQVYMTVPLSGIMDDESNGFGAVNFNIPGIMNGPMDGFALVKNDAPAKVLEFLSYGGVLVGLGGVANGMQSTDVGVAESGSSATNVSLQRVGTGNYGAAFTWTGPAVFSPGTLNSGQAVLGCGSVTVTFDNDSDNGGTGAIGDPKIVTRTYLLTDAAGNSTPVTQTITIEDTVLPEIICPENIVVDNDPGLCVAVVNYTPPVGTDNCAGPSTIQAADLGSGAAFPVGTTTEVFQVIDAAGNIASCSFTVKVEDAEGPVVDCKDLSADLDVNGQWEITLAFVLANAFNSRTDNCGLLNEVNINGPVNYTCDELGANSLTIYSLDINGNETPCTVTLTINDPLSVCNQPPVANCMNIQVNADAVCEASITAEQVNDGSFDPDDDALSFSLDNYGPFNKGIYTVELTVSDGQLEDKCTATVEVLDVTAPVLPVGPANVTVQCADNVPMTIELTAVDNCDGPITVAPTIETIPGACANDYVEMRTWTFVDAVGNTSSLSQKITVKDTQAPVLPTGPANVTVQCAANVPPAIDLTAVDNCDGPIPVSPTSEIMPGSNPNDFVEVRTWTFSDQCGNTSTLTQKITVKDTQAPTALCKTTTVQLGADGTATLEPTAIDNGSFDNCNQVSLSVSPDEFDCTDVGPQIVELTVTDLAGNSASCSVEITVVGIVTIDDVSVTDESCDGAGDGKIEITATGTGTLEYSIDGGTTFQDEPLFVALEDGTYDIIVRDKTYTDCEAGSSVTVDAGPICELTATDPCVCLNNASPFDMDAGTGGGDGQFSEGVTISADQPLPAGLIFRVIAPTTGVYDVYNVPAEGTQSAGVPVATDGSVTFTYNNGVYELPFVHNDAEGYTLTVVLEIEGVNSIGFQLSNTCFYPEPVITSDLDGPFCALSEPIVLEGNAGGAAGTGTFYIDGTEITVFNPADYAPGTYTISYVFDAGEALGYTLENQLVVGPPEGAATLAEAQADPGCESTVLKSVEIIPLPEGYACKEQVNVSLQDECQATLVPENVIGDLDCVDLSGHFDILVEDGDQTNGAVVDGCGRYRYILTDPDGTQCWGFVLAEDKQAPTLLECPESIRGISKNYGFQPFVCEDISYLLFTKKVTYTSDKDGNIDYDAIPADVKKILDITGYAKFIDNCGELTITVSDEVVYGYDPDCDDVKIVRTFTAVDACKGLLSPDVCYQEIIFTKPDLEDVYCPLDAELACDDEFKLDANGNPHPDVTGYPWVYTAFDLTDDDIENYKAYLAQGFCNLGASYTDGTRIEVCEGTYKLVRTWEILDWCTKEVIECQQIIKVGDTEAPEVTCVEEDYDNDGQGDLLSYSTGPYDCTAAFQVPMPLVKDNCSDWEVLTEIVGYSTDGPVVATILPGKSRYISGVPLGCHFIRYTVTDVCGNKTVVYCPFVVEDRVAPVAVCDDDLNISIGGQGIARVYASDIDEGSYDNCGPIRIEVRRRILAGAEYGCLDAFDYDGDGKVIGDEVNLSVQFGDPDGTGVGQEYYYTPWLDYVDFTCCDMNLDVRIELRVWDDRNGDGLPGNLITKTFCDEDSKDIRDNFNVCWLDVLVEDKLPAYCVPPVPAYIDCDKLPFDFDPANSDQMNELFGEASGTDNCPGYTITELEPLTDGLSDCGYGTFVRRFAVADAKGQTSTNSCQQVVTIKEQHYYKIKFPKDAAANCGDPQADTIQVEEIACDLLAISVKDDFFSASGDECYKIFRTYSVINWCEYDGQSDPVVVSRDEDCDGKPGDEDIWVIVKTYNKPDPCYDYYGGVQAPYYSHVWYDRDNDPFNLLPKAGTKGTNCDYETNPFGFWKEVVPVTENEEPKKDTDGYPKNYYGDHCADMASVGYWQYTQVIKVYDNVDPIISFDPLDPFCSYSSDFDNDCPAEVNIAFTIDENCTPDDLTITIYLDAYQDGIVDEDITDLLSGTYPNYTVKGSFPLGAHFIGVSVKDGCGNQVGINIPFEVVDCKAPTPVCINGLAIELMPVVPPSDVDGDGDLDRGAMAIWASDFIASPVSDCTGEVTYSINRVGEDPVADQTGLTLTCDDDASLLVEIWAWDGAGNGDFCETYVLVQDNMVNCGAGSNSGSIAGIIANEDLKTLSGVDVGLSGNSLQTMTTPNDGHYMFMDLGYNYDYTVTPYLDKNPLNGVSTFDLVLMSKHILGIQLLDSPYKMIAADVNNSKTITTLDAIQLRRLVLNIDIKFSNNTSWRFIPNSYVFAEPGNPWNKVFPEVININNLQGALDDKDFVAVKIGDLNHSARVNALDAEPRSISGRFALQVEEQELKAGQSYRVAFRAADLAQVQGYQMTLQLDQDAAVLEDVEYGVSEAINFGLRFVESGYLTHSWNRSGKDEAAHDADEVLFTLVLQARKDGLLSEVLHMSNRITEAEAYGLNDELLDVGLDFGVGEVAAAGFEVYQNVPNPFRLETSIGFYLPEEGEINVRIYDLSGRTIKLIRGDFSRGRHQISLTRAEVGAAGMLYYAVTSGEQTITRKMMVIE